MVNVASAIRCFLLLGLAVGTARADGTPPADAPARLPELSVEAQRIALEREVSVFVRGLTRNPGHADASLVRWNVPVCPVVVGLPAGQKAPFEARLSAAIRTAGAGLAGPGCRPNLVIVVTTEPSRVLRGWYARDAQLFGRAGFLEVRHFLDRSQARPVSAWYNLESAPAQGRAPLAHRLANQQSVQVSAQAEASHLAWNAVLSISSAFEVIDASQAQHVSVDQLADYAAMTTLTNIDLHAELGGASSILALFTPAADSAPAGLSRWDAAFLQALYRTDQASRVQRSQITDRVLSDLSH